MPSAEQHSVALAANAIRWLLTEGTLTHPGLHGHLTAAGVQLDAARRLLEAK